MAAIGRDDATEDESSRPFGVWTAVTLSVLAFFLAATVAISSYALWNEIVVSQAEALAGDAVDPAGSPPTDLQSLPQVEGLCLFVCQPRLLDAASAVRLAAAAALPADERGPLLARAQHDLALARAAEPMNGPVAIHQAYAASLAENAQPAYVLEQVERSYAVQPYSKVGGLWRVRTVARHWGSASANLKRLALREALWLPQSGTPEKAVTDTFEAAGLGLQLELARRVPPS